MNGGKDHIKIQREWQAVYFIKIYIIKFLFLLSILDYAGAVHNAMATEYIRYNADVEKA